MPPKNCFLYSEIKVKYEKGNCLESGYIFQIGKDKTKLLSCIAKSILKYWYVSGNILYKANISQGCNQIAVFINP